MDTVSEDVLLHMLDSDYGSTLSRLRESGDLVGLGIALCYGTWTPAGREFGNREQRSQWVQCQRAAHVRRRAVAAILSLGLDEQTMVHFVRRVRRKRGYGPILKGLVRAWHAGKAGRL